MQVVILAGGLGTRLAEETGRRPKPMVEIGGRPMLWHIMNIYAHYGLKDFIVACGYKSGTIKEYFRTHFYHESDYFVDLSNGSVDVVNPSPVDWRIGAIDTGLHTQTGGRLRRLSTWLSRGTFMVTYGDGLADVDITALLDFHRSHGKLATVTAVRPPARFGGLHLEGSNVSRFSEKPQADAGWINGGFFVFEPQVLDYLSGDDTVLEREPLEELAADGQLQAYRHEGFWQPMDTLRERHLLDRLWDEGRAPWKVWP